MSESFAEKLASLISPGPNGSDTKATNTPEAWRPRMEVGDDGGYLISTPRKAGESPDVQEILKEFDLDVNFWTVTSVRKSRWQTFNGDWLEASRLSLAPKVENVNSQDEDFQKILEEIKKWRPEKGSKQLSGDLAYIFAASDQQIGKKGSGEGTSDNVKRLLSATDGGLHRLKELRKIGRNIGTVVIALLGDHVEGNVSQGGKLQSPSASDLGLTQQTRVARRILLQQIKTFAPHCEKLIVPVVNGNHDEVTRQVSADPADGWNVEIASAVQDACAENDNLSHVEFRFPATDHQTLAVNINGTMLGLFHGHQVGKNVLSYLSSQAAGQTALGGCDLWLSGHYHHFASMDIGPRLWIQCPTSDMGSAWFRDRRGLESPAGVLTLVIGDGYDPRKDISIIPAERNKQ